MAVFGHLFMYIIQEIDLTKITQSLLCNSTSCILHGNLPSCMNAKDIQQVWLYGCNKVHLVYGNMISGNKSVGLEHS